MESVLFSSENRVWHLVLPLSHQAKQLGVPPGSNHFPPHKPTPCQPFGTAPWPSGTQIQIPAPLHQNSHICMLLAEERHTLLPPSPASLLPEDLLS